jgi:hypothetical protein
VRALTSLNGVEISLLCVGGAILFALVAGLIMRQLIQTGARESAGLTAAAYMTVLGSLFAILTGFLINTEYSTYRQAQNSVGSEVAAASELAYASASLPAADASLVQARLGTFLVTTSVQEWPHLAHDPEAPSPAAANVSQLSQLVYSFGPRPYVDGSTSDAMNAAMTGLTEARRQRIVIATQELPLPLFLLAVISGVALIAGSLLVALRSGPRYAFVAAGIILIVGFDLAAILSISAPFAGPTVVSVSAAPIEQVVNELRAGLYLPWIGTL